MNKINLDLVRDYVNQNIILFHEHRLKSLSSLSLSKLLDKNPYLFRAKNINTAGELISGTMEAFLSSSEEKIFGDFLEGLALYIASQATRGHKSTAPGIDLEFIENETYYIVSIKSGPNWGNSSQHSKLAQDFRNAVIRLKQSLHVPNVQPVLGICYGKTRTAYTPQGYLKVVGQNFWMLISGDPDLYLDIIEPLGHRAKEHNDRYLQEKARITNLLTKSFIDKFCDERGYIDWRKVVEVNSGNYDLDRFFPN
jgi:hypothetical protein